MCSLGPRERKWRELWLQNVSRGARVEDGRGAERRSPRAKECSWLLAAGKVTKTELLEGTLSCQAVTVNVLPGASVFQELGD